MKIIILLACLTVCGHPAWAGALSPHEIALRLQEVYRHTDTLSADFKQVTSNITGRHKRYGSGIVRLLKPGQMRWDYNEPEQQVLVCDGNILSMYFAKERQMVVASAKQYLESDVTYSFFAGTGDILRDFKVQEPTVEDLEEIALARQITIIPKGSHPQIDYINLWVDTKTFLLKKIKVTDKFGSQTDITFNGISRNIKLDPAIFHFTPPADTEIIKQ